jgi:2-deoxy-D-gluconate 3-dehydrogenase
MILDQFKLDGKVAIVTGASRGLGQGMADLALVGVSYMADSKKQIESLGRKCITISADLSKKDCVDGIVNTTVKRLGGIDILFNNAGIIRRAEFTEFTQKDWDDVMNVNISAVFFLSQAVVQVMIEHPKVLLWA